MKLQMKIDPPSSIYIHIPFCVKKCDYCDFTSYPEKEHLFNDYVSALEIEIDQAAAKYPDVHISTIYFGGGTPVLLPDDLLIGILNRIKSAFQIDQDVEITVESNPGIDVDYRKLRNAGFNRVSLGVQSFHDNELQKLGRIHSADDALEAISEIKNTGFANFSIDLMYGIPLQTFESWQKTLELAKGTGCPHISLYSLIYSVGTIFHNYMLKKKLDRFDEKIELDMYEYAIQYLAENGFEHYEISNFAKPGFRCRHNITYWLDNQYFGFGVGAYAYLKGTRSSNTESVEEYISRMNSGHSPIAFSEYLSWTDTMSETIFLALRMSDGIDAKRFFDRFGISIFDMYGEQIKYLQIEELLYIDGSHIKKTHKGLLFSNDVFLEFV